MSKNDWKNKPLPPDVIGLHELTRRVEMGRDSKAHSEKWGDFPMMMRVKQYRVGWFRQEVEEWLRRRNRPENKLIFECNDDDG